MWNSVQGRPPATSCFRSASVPAPLTWSESAWISAGLAPASCCCGCCCCSCCCCICCATGGGGGGGCCCCSCTASTGPADSAGMCGAEGAACRAAHCSARSTAGLQTRAIGAHGCKQRARGEQARRSAHAWLARALKQQSAAKTGAAAALCGLAGPPMRGLLCPGRYAGRSHLLCRGRGWRQRVAAGGGPRLPAAAGPRAIARVRVERGLSGRNVKHQRMIAELVTFHVPCSGWRAPKGTLTLQWLPSMQ